MLSTAEIDQDWDVEVRFRFKYIQSLTTNIALPPVKKSIEESARPPIATVQSCFRSKWNGEYLWFFVYRQCELGSL